MKMALRHVQVINIGILLISTISPTKIDKQNLGEEN